MGLGLYPSCKGGTQMWSWMEGPGVQVCVGLTGLPGHSTFRAKAGKVPANQVEPVALARSSGFLSFKVKSTASLTSWGTMEH